MGKIIGILMVVGMAWVGNEVYTKGVEDAFGGIFSNEPAMQAAEELQSTPERAGQRVEESMRRAEEKRNQQLDALDK